MSKALATFGTGQHSQCLNIARPFFEAYAARHDYAYIERDSVPVTRPTSWGKVPLLIDLLEDYDEVLWLDSDVVIVNGIDDLAAQVPADAWHAMVTHYTNEGEVPNCGVWFVRKPMLSILERVWEMAEYTYYPWWEQGAVVELLGYDNHSRPLRRVVETELYSHTHFLPVEWNSLEIGNPHPHPRFSHTAGTPVEWRLKRMQRRANEAIWTRRG